MAAGGAGQPHRWVTRAGAGLPWLSLRMQSLRMALNLFWAAASAKQKKPCLR